MTKKLLFIIPLALGLAACSTPKPKVALPAPEAIPANMSGEELAQAAGSISQSMDNLAAVGRAAHPTAIPQMNPSPRSYHMGERVSVNWSGPIEPFITRLAASSGYHVTVLGSKPAEPVLVTVNATNTAIGTLIQNAAYQARNRAKVLIFPKNRVVQLRYLPN